MKCEECIFFSLCEAAKLEHCEWESYYKDKEKEKSISEAYKNAGKWVSEGFLKGLEKR